MGQPGYSRLDSDEELSKQYEHDGLRKSSYRLGLSPSPFLYILDFTLALAIAFLLFRRHAHEKVQQFDLGSDITGYVPQIDHRLVTFTKEPQFISNHTSLESLREAREHWKTLVPRKFFVSDPQFRHRLLTIRLAGQLFVEINDELVKGRAMPKRITWKQDGREDKYMYGTAIVHSIHCLYSIMAEYDALALGLKTLPRDTLHMVRVIFTTVSPFRLQGILTLAGPFLRLHPSESHVCW